MIKEIWCMPHSHLDIGYTHPQPLQLKLQSDYLDSAMDLCLQTADNPEESRFCWTIEANSVVREWLKTASPERVSLLKQLIREERICVAALPMHTTPNCDARELIAMLSNLRELKEELETEIHVAINHDVNGQPWTFASLLLDSGIDFYLTGINIHFGGIPFPRPASFYWETPDGRKLLSFVGEQYSLFSQFFATKEHSTARMAEGAKEYTERLIKNGYTREFAFLTATNPPLYDNNCPDLELAEMVRKYNEEGHEQKIRIVTAKMLRDRLRKDDPASVKTIGGDWTDYWNFGCGSTARETRVSRLAKQTLKKAELLECLNGCCGVSEVRYQAAKQEAIKNSIVFDEHTWGAAQSVTEPDSPETYSQLIHKLEPAYRAADLAGYCLSTQAERYAGNPYQSNGLAGVFFVNTSAEEQEFQAKFPAGYRSEERQLAALRSKNFVPYLNSHEPQECAGLLKLPPFTAKCYTWEELENSVEGKEKRRDYQISGEKIETPFYQISIDAESGRICHLMERKNNRSLIDESRGYSLFEPVRETVDTSVNPAVRATIFPRDGELGNRNISQWNHEWKNKLEKAKCTGGWEIQEGEYQLTLIRRLSLPGTGGLVQKIIFYTYSPVIRMEVEIQKQPVYEPESIYFVVPLHISGGWEGCYDTAGELVRLDKEQLGNVCRDWVTVDTGFSIFDAGYCATLACPDAPLVQAGDFRFGRESKEVRREENPLLLGWATNNYWDTNFMANQSGRMEFAYELNFHKTFEPKTMLADGIHAQQPVVVGALVTEDSIRDSKAGAGETLLEGAGESVILAVYSSRQGADQAILAVVKNLSEQEDEYSLTAKTFELSGAAVVTPQEEVVEELRMEKQKVIVPMPPRGLRIVRLEKKR